MKKQLLAAAVATAIAAPMAATAGDVTVGGLLYMTVDSVDFDDAKAGNYGTATDTDGGNGFAAGYDGLAVTSHYSNFFIKGTEDLGNGLSAFFHIENYINPSQATAVQNNRNTFVGLGGNWGKVAIGRNDTPYKKSTGRLEMFPNLAGDYNVIGFRDVRMNNSVFYYSPNWNGFSFGVQLGMPSNNNGADGVEEVSVAATYANGPFFAALAYEERSEEFLGGNADDEKWRLGLGYTANGFHVGFLYEDNENVGAVDGADYDVMQVSASYTMGNNVFKISIGDRDDSNVADDADNWTIGVDHKLSKRTKLFALYSDFDDDRDDMDFDVFSVGILHKF